MLSQENKCRNSGEKDEVPEKCPLHTKGAGDERKGQGAWLLTLSLLYIQGE